MSKLCRTVNLCKAMDAPDKTRHTWVGTERPSLHAHSLGFTGRLSILRQILYFSSHGHVYDISHNQDVFTRWVKSDEDESMFLADLVQRGCYVGKQQR